MTMWTLLLAQAADTLAGGNPVLTEVVNPRKR